ncbi:MAG: ABC transporter ATP-binding protein [Candidatus Promineifilaceae bacterium]|nr:ABC transporter ATP-binding protein [Candidatus Promineifilaceae bacterium]
MKHAVYCEKLTKRYGDHAVVCDLSLAVLPGEILALLGPSGCGKTTTLRLIAGFERPDEGRIVIDDRVVSEPGRHMPPEARRVGMVFQDYAIFPHLNVAQNIAFGLGRESDIGAQIESMLALVGLGEVGQQMPHELSGGQQQRVALARALAPQPTVLLLDEPFSNLDSSLRVQVRAEVRDLLKESGATAIFVTHDQEEALFIGDRVALMNEGRLEQIGTPEEVFQRPTTRFVADFMGQTDMLPGITTRAGVQTPLGLLPRLDTLEVGTPVEVVIRPNDVRLALQARGVNDQPGQILRQRFVGIAYIYEVQLADGSVVHSWQPHTLHLNAGQDVFVSLRPGHAITIFAQDLVLSVQIAE